MSIRKLNIPLLCAIVCTFFTGAARAQVINGGFESGALAPFTASTSDGAASVYTAAQSAGDGSLPPHSGDYLLSVVSNAAEGQLTQPQTTITGGTYTISAWVATNDLEPSTNAVSLALGNNAPVACPALTNNWVLCTATFNALTNADALQIRFRTIMGSASIQMDDISITAPPAQVSVACTPTELSDSSTQQSLCTVSSNTAAGPGGLSINLNAPAANSRYSTTCASPIVIAEGQTSATCTVSSTPNTTVGDGDVTATLSIAEPNSISDYTITGSAVQITIEDDSQPPVISNPTPVPGLSIWSLLGLSSALILMGAARQGRRS